MNIDNVLKSHGIGIGGGSNIKSIQRGEFQLSSPQSQSITISAIDTTKSILKFTVSYPNSGQSSMQPQYSAFRGEITNSTTISFTRGVNTSAAYVVISWEVIEFNNVKSLQSGNLSYSTNAAESIVTVNSINTSKALLFFSFSTNNSDNDASGALLKGRIISNTSIGFVQNCLTGGRSVAISWRLIEFN